MPDWAQTLLTIVLSTGGLAFLSLLGRGWLNLRHGAAAKEQATIANIKQMRLEIADELRVESTDRRYWSDIAGRYHFQLRAAGFEPDPPDPVPPSQRNHQAAETPRPRRTRRPSP